MDNTTENRMGYYCVIPVKILFNDKMTAQEKMDWIMANFEEQSQAANLYFQSAMQETKAKSGVQK